MNNNALLAFLVVVIVGAAGYFVYENQTKDEVSLTIGDSKVLSIQEE